MLTGPVKLIRVQNNHHAKNIDGLLCTATITHLKECFLSQGDKARVPIGLTATNEQSPLLMLLEYRVCLPDHNWVVAAGQKLIPSVWSGKSRSCWLCGTDIHCN